jgi:drug/metabolite transporter (DMT)-like permease
MRGNAKGPLLIAATALLWSFGGLLIKLVPWDAMTIVGIRSLIAGAVMAVYMRRPRITFSPAVILGGLSLSATTILFVFANKLTTAANAIVLQYVAPIFVLILSAIFLKKRFRTPDIAAVIVVFIGIALFFFDRLQANALLGNILAVLAGVSFAGVFLINQMKGAKPEEALLLGHIINFIVSIPFVVKNVTFEPMPWLYIVLLGVFQLGLAYVLFSIGIRRTPPVQASLIATLEPLLNPVWVLLLTGERPGLFALIGGAVVITTIVIYSIGSSKKQNQAKAAPAAG